MVDLVDDFLHAAAQVAFAGLALELVKQQLQSVFVVLLAEESGGQHQHVLLEVVVMLGVFDFAELFDPQVREMLALRKVTLVPEVARARDEVLLLVVIFSVNILVPNSLLVGLG